MVIRLLQDQLEYQLQLQHRYLTALSGRLPLLHAKQKSSTDAKRSRVSPKAVFSVGAENVCFQVPPQPIDATHALNRSAGVSNPSVLRGRSFS